MEVSALVGLAIACGTSLVAITVHATRTRNVADDTQGRVVQIEAWRNRLPRDLDIIYLRRNEADVQFRALTESLARIEARQTKIADRLLGPGA